MRTIILGYADAAADAESGVPLKTAEGALLTFSDEDFNKSKSAHRFPKGVKQLKSFEVSETDCSVFIGEDVTDHLEKSNNARNQKEVEISEKAKAISAREKPINDARAKVQSTARLRNDIMGRLHSEKSKLNALEATPESLRGKSHDKNVKDVSAKITGDEKTPGLEKQVADAVSTYDQAAKEYDDLLKTVNPVPQPKSQFVEA